MEQSRPWKRFCNAVASLAFTVVLLYLSAGLAMAGCSKTGQVTKDKDYINYISFSADGKKILFDRQKDGGPYQIQVYDLETHELSAYQPPSTEQWTMARYSFDGKHIVLSIIPRGPKGLDLSNMQLAVMDPGGKNIRKITNSSGPKIYPSFSHSGDKVIYAKAETIREKGHTPAADYDIYEVNIKTGNETRLTFFKLFTVSAPYLLPDDEAFIFGAYGPPDMRPLNYEKMKDYIYIIRKGERVLPKPLISLDSNDIFLDGNNILNWDRNGTREPLVSIDGTHVYFVTSVTKSGSNYGEGNQVFEYSKIGKNRRVTTIIPSSISSASLSPDGQYLAIIFDPVQDSAELIKIAICNIKDSTSRLINLPDQPSRIIDQR